MTILLPLSFVYILMSIWMTVLITDTYKECKVDDENRTNVGITLNVIMSVVCVSLIAAIELGYIENIEYVNITSAVLVFVASVLLCEFGNVPKKCKKEIKQIESLQIIGIVGIIVSVFFSLVSLYNIYSQRYLSFGRSSRCSKKSTHNRPQTLRLRQLRSRRR